MAARWSIRPIQKWTGDMRPGTKQAVIYLRALRALLADDPEHHADYIGVSQMTTRGAMLIRPDRMCA
jgi:hypothetical protein